MGEPRDDHTLRSESERDKHVISLTRGIQNMTRINLSIKQNDEHREQTGGWQGESIEGRMEWELGLADTKGYI